MGGPGSENHWRYGAKSTTDDYRALDVRHWAREGMHAAKDALLWLPAGGHGRPVKHSGLADPQAVQMIALDPEAHVGVEEGRDLSSSVIMDIIAPIAVKSLWGSAFS